METILTSKRIIQFTAALLAVLIAFMAVKTVSALRSYSYIGGGVPPSNTLSISGTGEVFAVPDIATITFSLRETGTSVADTQTKVAEKSGKALAFLKRSGIADKDIKTVSYSAYPEYEFRNSAGIPCTYGCPTGKRVLVGYTVNESIGVKVRATDKVGAILDGLAKEAAPSELGGPDFSIDDQNAVMREARKKAIADAEKKAEDLASDLGVTLVRIVNFSEAGMPVYYAKAYLADGRGGAGAPEAAPSLPAGENKITSNVTITYEIR